MSRKERQRLSVLHQVESRTLTLKEAAAQMRVCYRQAKRIWQRYRKSGDEGLLHRSRGGLSNRRLPADLRARVVALYRRCYPDFGPTLASEKMAEQHALPVHPETLRRWLLAEGCWPGRTKLRKHRRRRPRRPSFGELVQMDGSDHAWFEGRGKSCCLMVMVDDATGVFQARFAAAETTRAAFESFEQWIRSHGAPAALYCDRKNVYVAQREPNRQEKQQGSGALTQFGRACWNLGTSIIPAGSPQAKGRVERHNGVLQDRLVKELRLRGISDIASANAMLPEYCKSLSARFGHAPESLANAHRALPPHAPLEDLLCWEEARRVGNDWTINYGGRVLQIEHQPNLPPAGSRVVVRERMDASVSVLWGDHALRYTSNSPSPPARRRPASRPPWGAAAPPEQAHP